MAKETILVVDDSAEVTKILRKYMLEPRGYQVIVASDGQAGFEKALKYTPDLILLDMNMPQMSGLETIRALRQAHQEMPVIFMTVSGSEHIVVEAFRLGVKDYLSKPFTDEDVITAVDKALREVRLLREKEQLSHNLIAAETVRQTVTTLSHHINNAMMALGGNLHLMQEILKEMPTAPPELSQMAAEGQMNILEVVAVLRVLRRLSQVESRTYHGSTQMINVEQALAEEMKRIQMRISEKI